MAFSSLRLRERQHHGERAAAEIADPLVVIELMLEALGHFLQQQVAHVPAEAVVHVAQPVDVEGNDHRPRGGTECLLQEVVEPLAEQRALGRVRSAGSK